MHCSVTIKLKIWFCFFLSYEKREFLHLPHFLQHSPSREPPRNDPCPAEPWEHQARAHPFPPLSWLGFTRTHFGCDSLIVLPAKADGSPSRGCRWEAQPGSSQGFLQLPAAALAAAGTELSVRGNAWAGHLCSIPPPPALLVFVPPSVSSSRAELGVVCGLFVPGECLGWVFYTYPLWDLVFSPVRGLLSTKRAVPSTLDLFILNLLSQHSNAAGARGHP